MPVYHPSSLVSSSLTQHCNSGPPYTQIAMQDRGLKPPEDVLGCSRPLIERRLKPQSDQVLKCPRCESLNTKFCYYNNYSLSQPRHFCKNCRRYWTKGGALRNVPVGGGCRKNKRTKQRTGEQSSTSHQNESASTANMGGESSSCPPLPENMSGVAPGSLYYTLPNAPIEGDDMSHPYSRAQQPPSLRLADQAGHATSNSGLFGVQGTSHLSSLPHSTLTSLSNHLSSLGALPLRNGFMGLDFSGAVRPEHGTLGVADLCAFFEAHPHLAVTTASTSTGGNEGLTAFSLALDSYNGIDQDVHWKTQQHKLAHQTDDGHIGQAQVLIPFENQSVESLRHPQLRPGLTNMSPCRKVEDTRPGDWHGQEGFFDAATETSYWNHGGWSDLSGYGPSASPLL